MAANSRHRVPTPRFHVEGREFQAIPWDIFHDLNVCRKREGHASCQLIRFYGHALNHAMTYRTFFEVLFMYVSYVRFLFFFFFFFRRRCVFAIFITRLDIARFALYVYLFIARLKDCKMNLSLSKSLNLRNIVQFRNYVFIRSHFENFISSACYVASSLCLINRKIIENLI